MWVDGDYAYIGAGYTGGLQIWDISDRTNPTHVTRLDDTMDFGRGVQVDGNTCYLACRDSNEFVSIDVSNPGSPSVIDRVSGADLDGARGIDYQGNYAYVALGHFTSGGSPSEGEGLTVVDTSDPANLSVVTNLNGNDGDIYAAGDAHVNGNYCYLSGYQDGVVMVIDISDPQNPSHVHTWDPAIGTARGIDSTGNTLFLNSPSDNSVISIDISDPTNLSEIDRVASPQLAGSRANHLVGDNLFVSSRIANRIVWVDVADPANLQVAASVYDPNALDEAYGCFADGTHVFAGCAGSGDHVIASYARDE